MRCCGVEAVGSWERDEISAGEKLKLPNEAGIPTNKEGRPNGYIWEIWTHLQNVSRLRAADEIRDLRQEKLAVPIEGKG